MRIGHDRQTTPDRAPLVGRPRGSAWRALQADGVVWEGQVLIVGDDVDLAARVIVTHRRVAFVRGGQIVLEIARDWLRPAPILRRDNTILLSITAPSADPFAEPETIALRMRDGHPAAGHLIAMLAGSGARRLSPDAVPSRDHARGVLPPLPEPDRPGLRALGQSDPSFRELPALPAGPVERDPFAVFDRRLDEPTRAEPTLPEPIVRPPSPPVSISRDRDWNLRPIRDMVPRGHRRRRGWTFRLGGLLVLLALAAFFGAGQVPSRLGFGPGGDRPPAATTGPAGDAASQLVAPTATATAAPAAEAGERTAVALGVGGPEPTATTAATQPPTAVPIPTPSGATVAADQPASAVAPTEAPEPTPTPPSPPTAAPTAATAPAPTATAKPAPPAAQTTQAPGGGATAGQTVVSGPLRASVELANRAATLPQFGLAPAPDGDWVALILHVRNAGSQQTELPMTDLQLVARPSDETVALDDATGVVASMIGLEPAVGADDVVRLDPGQSRWLALIYQVPTATEGLTLEVGATAVDLDPAFAAGRSLADLDLAADLAEPELVEATVTEVIDGERLAVDLAGQRAEIRQLGLAAPTGDACYAVDAAAASSQLVQGKTVWLERESQNVDGDGVPLRDVWLDGGDGSRTLLAAKLIESGAATPDPAVPSRYTGWLAATAAIAQANGAGLWGACATAVDEAGVASASSEVRERGQAGFAPVILDHPEPSLAQDELDLTWARNDLRRAKDLEADDAPVVAEVGDQSGSYLVALANRLVTQRDDQRVGLRVVGHLHGTSPLRYFLNCDVL